MDALVPYERRITTEPEILPPQIWVPILSQIRNITPVDKSDEGVVD